MNSDAFDVIIIGGGPAGIAAAVTLTDHGKRVLMVDDGPDAGGQIWRAQERLANQRLARFWLTQLAQQKIVRWHNHRFLRRQQNRYFFVGETTMRSATASQLILATGAQEIILPFDGWTQTHVTGAGALQALIKNGLTVRDQQIVIAGGGPLLLACAETVLNAGGKVAAIVEQASWWQSARFAFSLWRYPSKIAQLMRLLWRLRDVRYWRNAHVISTQQNAVCVRHGTQNITLQCDALAVAYGLQSNIELARHFGLVVHDGAIAVDDDCQTSCANVYAIGECNGVGGVDKALIEGQLVAAVLCRNEKQIARWRRARRRVQPFMRALKQFCAVGFDPQSAITQDTPICRCEDVTHQALQNCRSGREARLYTRVGMGCCQGRVCSAICERLYGWSPSGQRATFTALPVQMLLPEEKS